MLKHTGVVVATVMKYVLTHKDNFEKYYTTAIENIENIEHFITPFTLMQQFLATSSFRKVYIHYFTPANPVCTQ